MSENNSIEDAKKCFEQLAKNYKNKLSPKFESLLPFKDYIEGLLKKGASYNDLRLLLEDVNVFVSADTMNRFCRKIIGQRATRWCKPGPEEVSQFKISSSVAQPIQSQPKSVEAKARKQWERFPGPWSRRKRGPRIADSKNL